MAERTCKNAPTRVTASVEPRQSQISCMQTSDGYVVSLDCKIRMASTLSMKRAEARARLDAASDFVVVDGRVCFSQSFETVEDDEAS